MYSVISISPISIVLNQFKPRFTSWLQATDDYKHYFILTTIEKCLLVIEAGQTVISRVLTIINGILNDLRIRN